MAEFFNMGGYAAFVWTAFGATTVVMVGMWLQSVLFLKARQTELAALQDRVGRAGQ